MFIIKYVSTTILPAKTDFEPIPLEKAYAFNPIPEGFTMQEQKHAVPETSAYSDVYSAFETGQIDAAENNWPAYYSMEHYKVARYYMADEHSRVPEVQLASGRTWNALPEEYRQILQECARASAQYERQLWAQEETTAREAALAGGCRELPLPEEEMQNFRQLVQPLYKKYCADYLPLVEEIQRN